MSTVCSECGKNISNPITFFSKIKNKLCNTEKVKDSFCFLGSCAIILAMFSFVSIVLVYYLLFYFDLLTR